MLMFLESVPNEKPGLVNISANANAFPNWYGPPKTLAATVCLEPSQGMESVELNPVFPFWVTDMKMKPVPPPEHEAVSGTFRIVGPTHNALEPIEIVGPAVEAAALVAPGTIAKAANAATTRSRASLRIANPPDPPTSRDSSADANRLKRSKHIKPLASSAVTVQMR